MRIPINEAVGNAVARPGPQVQAVPGAFDNGLGRALQQTGQVLGEIEDAERAKQEQARKEAEAERKALDRARAANAALDYELGAKTVGMEIEQGLADGSLKADDVPDAYRKRMAALPQPNAEGYDPVTALNLSRTVKRADFTVQAGISRAATTAMKGELKSHAEGVLDKLGKQASMPGADPAKLAAQADAMDEIGRRAYGAAWDKRKQDWKDNTWYAHLSQQAMTVRDSLDGIKGLEKAITSGTFADKLDSERRNTLIAKLEGYRTTLLQRQEVAAARAERQAERRMRHAEAEFNTFQAMSDKGTVLDPAYGDRVLHATEGTPYQQAVVAILKQARETGGIAAQPVRVQQAMLDEVDRVIAQQGRSPELDRRREQLSKVLAASKAALTEDGMRAGVERGVVTSMAPLDMSTPQGLAASLPARLEQAALVGTWAGKAVSPFNADEADQVRTMLGALPPKVRAQAVSTIAQTAGPKAAAAIARQIDAKDRALSLAFASAGSKTTAGRYTSELIMAGAAALRDKAVAVDDKKVTGWQAAIAEKVNGALPNEEQAAAVRDAAYMIAAGIAAEEGGSVSDRDISRAVRIAVGGDIIERNGAKVPIPAGMDAGDFEDRLRGVKIKTADGKVRVAGQEMSAEEFSRSIPGQTLVPVGYGRYAVVVRGRPVTDSRGNRITFEVR